MQTTLIINLTYVVSTLMFILGLKRLSSPATARSGNALSSIGMLLAILVTLISKDIISYHGLFLKAAKRRVRDQPHVVFDDKDAQTRAMNLLKQTDDLRPRIHKSGKPISSNIEIAFLKEF